MNSQSWRERPKSNLVSRWLPLPMLLSDFRSVAFFWNYSASKAKSRPNFDIFDPCVKLGEGSVKCQSQPSSIIVTQAATIRFLTCCSVLKPQSVKGDWCWKIEPKFRTVCPLQNLGEGWTECLSELIKFNLGPNLWYTFAGSPLWVFGQGSSDV